MDFVGTKVFPGRLRMPLPVHRQFLPGVYRPLTIASEGEGRGFAGATARAEGTSDAHLWSDRDRSGGG